MKLGVWAHPMMNYPEGSGSIEKTFAAMSKAGISIYYPYACLRGDGCYKSNIINQVTQEDFLEKIVEIAPHYGIEVHPVVAFASPSMQQAELFVGHGAPKNHPIGRSACPSSEYNRQLILNIMTELMENYKIQGIHLDYMRYPNVSYSLSFPCECDSCRKYRKDHWGEDLFSGNDMKEPGKLYMELCMRAANIKNFVTQVRSATLSAGLALSMAAREYYIEFALTEGQDWVEWSRENLVDVVCPMSYSTDFKVFKAFFDEHLRLLKDGKALYYAGIGRKSDNGETKPADMIRQIEYAADNGAAGCTIFHFGAFTEEDFERLGAIKL